MTGTKESNVYLASKPRYEILDGLRGVAAVFVLAVWQDQSILPRR